MPSWLPNLIFALVALGVLAGLHAYAWARLLRDPGWGSTRLLRLSPWAFGALGSSVVLSLALPNLLGVERARPLAFLGMAWLGLLILWIFLLAPLDSARGLYLLVRRIARRPVDLERRKALSRLLAGAVGWVGIGLGIEATRSGLAALFVKRIEVALPRLPHALDGLRIVQLTDVHVGPTIGVELIEEIVAKTNALKPDLIAITGDLVDGDVPSLAAQVAPLAKLRSRYGSYFVTGNHEYYSGADSWCAHLGELGLRVLSNERVSIGEGDDSFDLAGVDDYASGRFGRGPDLEAALRGRDSSRECVLLAHQPRAAREASRLGVGLQLSGHTHGGQLWPWGLLVRLQQPVVSGLGRVGRTLVYVSNGTGYWGPPMRLAAPAEITEVVLRATA